VRWVQVSVSPSVDQSIGLYFTKIVFGKPSAAKNLSKKASALICAWFRMPSSMAALRISCSAVWRAVECILFDMLRQALWSNTPQRRINYQKTSIC